MVGEWVVGETLGVELGDRRLNERLGVILDAIGGRPTASIPEACGGWAETAAAYRFFDNARVEFEAILEPHAEATIRRMAEYERVVLVQDTTEIDLTRPEQQVVGAGPLDGGARRGLFLHPLCAVSPDGTPLGTLHGSVWTRDEVPDGRDRRQRPIEEKESRRWVDGMRAAREVAARVPGTRLVQVSDSESDLYELLELATSGDVDWVVRASHDRALQPPDREGVTSDADGDADGDADESDAEPGRLRGRLIEEGVSFELNVAIRAREAKVACETRRRRTSRAEREARVAVRAARLTLRPPFRRGRKPSPLAVNAVLAREVDPPEGEEPIEWLLLTNLPIGDAEAIREVLATYRVRWVIEVFFQTLKSGCHPEDRRFEHVDRHRRALAVWLIVTWRTLFVCRLAREFPDENCELVFEPAEWRSAHAVVYGESPPRDPPTLREAVRLIAGLGGYLARPRRRDPPGPKTVWRGLQRVHDFALCWTTFGPGRQQPP